jgi:hypothetical protein
LFGAGQVGSEGMVAAMRGRIANLGFEDQRVRGVYFFAGNWRFAPPGQPVHQFYEFPVGPNDSLYTLHPTDRGHLGWSESQANREFALDAMVEAGANTVVMSYWGERGADRWAFWAPMQTSTHAHDELFAVAASRPLLIMPAIESGAATIDVGGRSNGFNFASDFPGSPADPSPGLVYQCIDLINRYLNNSDHPEWRDKWLQLFDRNGERRYAINILHVSSNQIPEGADEVFAAGFDWVADRIFELSREKVGFTLDILRGPQTLPPSSADFRSWVPWFRVHGEALTRSGAIVTALWASQSHLDLFMIGASGAVLSIWWDKREPAGYRPEGWFPIHSEQRFPPGGHVTVVLASADHLDLFAVDVEGTVRSIWWDRAEPAGYRPQGWFAVHSKTGFPPGSPIAAAWANRDHLDLFAADIHGIVQSIWWDRAEPRGYRPGGWFSIRPEVRTAPGGYITAQWSTQDHLDLFMVSSDRAVSSIRWDRHEASGYRAAGWFSIGSERRFQPGAHVAALWAPSQQQTHLDLFTVDVSGTVVSIWWDANSASGYRPEGWFSIGENTRTRAGAFVSACWIGDTELHLAIADGDGTVRGANWKIDQVGGWQGWFPIRLGFASVPGETSVLLSREPSHVDLFLVDPVGVVQSTFRAAIRDTYVARARYVGRFLEQTASVLAIQGFIPEVGGTATDAQRLQVKNDYWMAWLGTGVPVLFDVCPGYDAHLVFPGSSRYGDKR